jgi:hypothetical protein
MAVSSSEADEDALPISGLQHLHCYRNSGEGEQSLPPVETWIETP